MKCLFADFAQTCEKVDKTLSENLETVDAAIPLVASLAVAVAAGWLHDLLVASAAILVF